MGGFVFEAFERAMVHRAVALEPAQGVMARRQTEGACAAPGENDNESEAEGER